jgi:GAF domain-containing protein
MQNPQPAANLFDQLVTPRYRYSDVFDIVRARVTILYAFFSIIASLLCSVVGIALQGQPINATALIFVPLIVVTLPSIGLLYLINKGFLRIATIITYVSLLAAAAVSVVGGNNTSSVIVLALPLLYAGLVWQWRGTLLTLAIELIMVTVGFFIELNKIDAGTSTETTASLAFHAVVIIVVMLSSGMLSGMASSELRRSLRYTTRLVTQLRATSEVAQRTSSLASFAEMTQQAVNFVRDRFGFYHVQIFIVDDEQRYATLQASTGEAGEALIKRAYRLGLGSKGAIGQVTLLGEPVIVDTELDENRNVRRDEVLPETRSELVLPLIARERIIGALDIQSTQSNAFRTEDIESLGIMASHLSIAINNARTFQEQTQVLNENRRLFLEAETNLREIQMLNQRLTGQAWDEYLRARSTDVVGYTLSDNLLRMDNTWTPALAEATSKRQPIMTSNGDRHIVVVPVELRGRAIGAIEVETSGTARQSDTLEMLTSVANRLALSIDNARLFEQAQELAQQELEVNAISARMQGVTNMNELLKTAINELSRALGAEQASIRLGVTMPTANENSSSNRLGVGTSSVSNTSNSTIGKEQRS